MDKEKGALRTMEKETVEKELISLIGEVMPELTDVDLKKDFVSEYGVNSISIIRLIVAVEEKFKISFTDYELALEGYQCFGDVAALIAKKLDDKE
jgi:acyl carrier protein